MNKTEITAETQHAQGLFFILFRALISVMHYEDDQESSKLFGKLKIHSAFLGIRFGKESEKSIFYILNKPFIYWVDN